MAEATLGARWAAWGPRLRSVLRIVAAGMYLLHGTTKLFGFPGGGSPVMLLSQFGLGGVIETVGGTLLLLGLFTRPVAFLVAGELAVIYWQFHFPQSPWPVLSHGEVPALYCFVFLYLSAVGPGPWSVDARRGGSAG